MLRPYFLAKRLVLLLFILLLGCAPAALAREESGSLFQPGELKSRQVLPADTTFLFANFSGVDQLLEDRASLDLFKLWAEEEVQAFFAQMKEETLARLSGGGDAGFPFSQVWDLFQGELTVACSSRLTIFERGAVPAPALLVDMGNDKESFLGTIDFLLGQVIEMHHLEKGGFEYRGTKINTIKMPWSRLSICHTAVGNLFVATVNRHYMQEIIDTSLGKKDPLAACPAFSRSLRKLGGDSLRAMAYVSLQPVIDMLKPVWPYEFDEWSSLLGIGPIDSLALGTACEGGGARDSLFIGCPGKKRGS